MFKQWSSQEGPPSHSIPPHTVAKAAALISPEAFKAVHESLLKAYFTDNRDITSTEVLLELWTKAGLPEKAFDQREQKDILREIIAEHNEAIENGATGVPAVRLEDTYGCLVGAESVENYRRMITSQTGGGPVIKTL